jgi:ribonuclease BN (tRNA processing enzyme)
LCLVPLEVGQVVQAGEREIEVLPARHTVPAVGYAVLGSPGAWVFSGDTGPNPELWQRLASMPVAALVIETAFRDDEHVLATISQHLCPAQLKRELEQLQAPADVYITHIKPGEVDAVMSEIGAQASRHRISALVSGQVMVVG